MSQISLALGTRNIIIDNVETTIGIEVIQQSSRLLLAGLFFILVKTLITKSIINSNVLIVPAIPMPMANLPRALKNKQRLDINRHFYILMIIDKTL